MELTIEIPEKLIQRAEELGVPVKALVDQALNQILEDPILPGFVPLGVPTMSRAEATVAIREIQKNHTLGGLSIEDLLAMPEGSEVDFDPPRLAGSLYRPADLS